MSSDKIDEVEMTLGDMLRETRKMMGLNQTQLAEILGISVDYVSKIEKNKREPRDYLLSRIQKFIRGDVVLQIREDDSPPGKIATFRHPDPQIDAVIKMMETMDEEGKKGVRTGVEKEKLLRELLQQREEKKAG